MSRPPTPSRLGWLVLRLVQDNSWVLQRSERGREMNKHFFKPLILSSLPISQFPKQVTQQSPDSRGRDIDSASLWKLRCQRSGLKERSSMEAINTINLMHVSSVNCDSSICSFPSSISPISFPCLIALADTPAQCYTTSGGSFQRASFWNY